MAQSKPVQPKKVTWQEKLNQGHALNPLEETQADADFNYRRRLREEEEKAAFEKLKAAGRTTPEAIAALDEETSSNGEKGN